MSGIKVLCVARLLPGAYCTKLLADLGAEITMLEHPKGGDPMRLRHSFFVAMNGGKKSVTVDLGSGEDSAGQLAERSWVGCPKERDWRDTGNFPQF